MNCECDFPVEATYTGVAMRQVQYHKLKWKENNQITQPKQDNFYLSWEILNHAHGRRKGFPMPILKLRAERFHTQQAQRTRPRKHENYASHLSLLVI